VSENEGEGEDEQEKKNRCGKSRRGHVEQFNETTDIHPTARSAK
jgi:hypothetical protein